MIIKYSDNIFYQIGGVLFHNMGRISAFTLIGCFAAFQKEFSLIMGWEILVMPAIPVSILGGALAIFLAFRNNHAYDRWWEARKVWGGIVNASRTMTMMILSFGSTHYNKENVTEEQVKSWQKELIYRHLAWVNSLVQYLRTHHLHEDYSHYISKEELELVKTKNNLPAHLIYIQGLRLKEGFEQGIIEDFRHMELVNMIKELNTLQGQAERIKKTVFPYYYNYFTRVFMWVFILAFPFVLVSVSAWWVSIPMSVVISFVFSILEKSGTMTEEPFEDRAADTPMSSITRSIEIDVLEMLGDENIPSHRPSELAHFDVEYMK